MNDGPGRHDDERGAAGGAQKQQQGRRRAHGFGCTRVKDTARRWKFVEVPRLRENSGNSSDFAPSPSASDSADLG